MDVAKIIELSKLYKSYEPNWDSYEAEPPNQETILAAEFLAIFILGDDRLSLLRYAPSVVGGMGLTLENDIYIEFYNSGNIYTLLNDGTTRDVTEWPTYKILNLLADEEYKNHICEL